MGPVATHLIERWATEHTASWARMARPLSLVIAVEQESIALVERRVAEEVIAQDEGLEEPSRVGEVPFGRRGVGEWLDRGVGVRQRRREVERQLARREQPRRQGPGGLEMSLGRHQRRPCHEICAGGSTKFSLCSNSTASRRATFLASTRHRLLRPQRQNARRRKDDPKGD